jgi:cell division protein FtsB
VLIKSRQKFIVGCLLLEGIIFFVMCQRSPYGPRAQEQLRKENAEIECHIEDTRRDIEQLTQECKGLDDDFYVEKIARERLQMARSSDIIYYIVS